MKYKFLKRYAIYQPSTRSPVRTINHRIYFIFWAIQDSILPPSLIAYTNGKFIEGLEKLPNVKTKNKKELLEQNWNGLEKFLKKGVVKSGRREVKITAVAPVADIPVDWKENLEFYYKSA